MEGPRAIRRRPWHSARAIVLWGGICACALRNSMALAEPKTHLNGFDDPQHSWETESDQSAVVLVHRRTAEDVHSGAACEQVVISTGRPGLVFKLSQEVPDSLVFEELTASLWIKSNRPGLRLGVRVRFPHEVDPRTGQPLVADLLGDSYSKSLEWQRLTCRTSNEAVQELVARYQSLLRPQPGSAPIDQRGMTVEAVVLHLELQTGPSQIAIDDLSFSPIVAPADQQAAVEPRPFAEPELDRRLVIGDDRLLLDGKPFIPRFMAYHGEQVDALAEAGINVVWIERYDDPVLLAALRDAGLFAMAAPPQPPFSTENEPDHEQEIGLLSLNPGTEQILFWNVGTRLPAGNVKPTAAWTDLIREADFQRARPILADVVGSEREFHRSLDVLGSSRHILHTSSTPREYFEYLLWKRKMALQDKPSFTFIQTEPSTANLTSRAEGQALPAVEPEQIWLQSYAALSAGYKGIGYWKYSPLTATTPGGEERRLAITLFNAHVATLEPWLATGKLVEIVPATLGFGDEAEAADKSPFGLPLDKLRPGQKDKGATPPSDIQVAVIQCEQGLLLIPVWYENGAQFQPGPMAAPEISFVITKGGDNAQAWEITTTNVTPLQDRIERVAGGTLIRLRDFDQHALIALTWGADKIPPLKQHIDQIKQQCARSWIDLASAKVTRVADVHARLAANAIPVRDADWVLAQARRYVDQAEADFRRGDFDGARRDSRAAMQFTRTVQRRHWDNAVSKLTSGVSSPHTVCFQTLPDYWSMVAAIGQRDNHSENLLRSGGFEDSDTMFASGWEHEQSQDQRVRPWAELFGTAAEGKYCLHLIAGPADPDRPPAEVLEPPERFVSPRIPVYAGQIVHISGQVQIVTPLTGNPDGLVIFESIKGTVGALRWREPTEKNGWQRFDLFREVQQSDELQVIIELRALGDVRIDDLQVVTINPE